MADDSGGLIPPIESGQDMLAAGLMAMYGLKLGQATAGHIHSVRTRLAAQAAMRASGSVASGVGKGIAGRLASTARIVATGE